LRYRDLDRAWEILRHPEARIKKSRGVTLILNPPKLQYTPCLKERISANTPSATYREQVDTAYIPDSVDAPDPNIPIRAPASKSNNPPGIGAIRYG